MVLDVIILGPFDQSQSSAVDVIGQLLVVTVFDKLVD